MNKVRKQWLVSFYVYISFQSLVALYTLLVGIEGKKIEMGISLFFLLIWALITFHCAYRAKGTAWLLWLVIAFPFGILNELGKLLKELNAILGNLEGWITNLIWVGAVGISLWFWINCIRLRRENLALRKSMSQSQTLAEAGKEEQ